MRVGRVIVRRHDVFIQIEVRVLYKRRHFRREWMWPEIRTVCLCIRTLKSCETGGAALHLRVSVARSVAMMLRITMGAAAIGGCLMMHVGMMWVRGALGV